MAQGAFDLGPIMGIMRIGQKMIPGGCARQFLNAVAGRAGLHVDLAIGRLLAMACLARDAREHMGMARGHFEGYGPFILGMAGLAGLQIHAFRGGMVPR